MKIEELFVVATREKYRFKSATGVLTTMEDLYELPLTSLTKLSLDSIAISLSNELKQTNESFVSPTKSNVTLERKLEIVKFIINERLEAKREIDDRKKRKEQLESIERLIEEKQEDSLRNMSLEDLQKLKDTL